MRNLLLLLLACMFGTGAYAQLTCNASISASMNQSTVTLTNNSTPVASSTTFTNYLIDWGDNSTPTSVNNNSAQTHTYLGAGNFTISLYSSVIDSPNFNQVCRDTATTTVTASGVPCGATISKSQLANNKFQFTGNNVSSTAGMTYSWAYGDGNTGNGKTTVHTYATAGTYTVRLITQSSAASCVDTQYTTVNVTLPQNNISGYIFTDSNSNNNRDTFKVWLIRFNASNNILSAVDSQVVSGYSAVPYSFNSPTSGNYRTKAHHLNGPTSGTGLVPTYHDSALLWSNANVINHTGGATSGKHIYMKTGTVTAGPGFVGGNVTQGANKGTAGAIEGMNILLLNSNNQPVAYDVTDVNGDYTFSNIPNGTYTVHPEQLNFSTTAATVVISNGSVSYTNINFERSLSNKTILPKAVSVVDVNSKELSFVMYPNPAYNKVVLNWAQKVNEKADVTISDISGKKVYTTQVEMQGQSVIEFGELQTGFYILNVSSDLGSSTHKLFIQH